MVRINAMQRKFLEEMGIIKPRNISYKWHDEKVSESNGMTVCNKQAGTKAKSYYVEDSFIAYIDPEWFRRISEKYHSKEVIEGQIRHAKWYVERHKRNKESKS